MFVCVGGLKRWVWVVEGQMHTLKFTLKSSFPPPKKTRAKKRVVVKRNQVPNLFTFLFFSLSHPSTLPPTSTKETLLLLSLSLSLHSPSSVIFSHILHTKETTIHFIPCHLFSLTFSLLFLSISNLCNYSPSNWSKPHLKENPEISPENF